MQITEHFKTPIWVDYKPDFIKSLDKFSDKYIKDSKNKQKKYIKKYGDFGMSYHSTSLLGDNNFLDFTNYVGQKSWDYLDHQGFDMQQHLILFFTNQEQVHVLQN